MPGDPGHAGPLARFVGDPERFLADAWGRRAHLHAASDVTGLLTVDDVDHLISSTALRAPAFRVVKGGATLNPATWTRRARIGSRTVTDLIDVGRVYDHFAEGATIVLQGLHRYWPPVADVCRDLEAELTHPVQANAYITPPVAQGLKVHADRHDVFAVQTHGRKQWVVYEGDRQQPGPDGSNATPTLDRSLQAGDCLYLPKGVPHAARTVDCHSIHLTLGVRALTWGDLLASLFENARSDALLDEPLPAGFAHRPEELADEAARRLYALAERLRGLDPARAVDQAARAFWARRLPDLRGQLRQLLATADVEDATMVRRRPGAACDLACRGDLLEVVLSDRTLRMPVAAAPAMRRALDLAAFKVSDLRDHLDEPGRVALVRRLVREGLLMVVDG